MASNKPPGINFRPEAFRSWMGGPLLRVGVGLAVLGVLLAPCGVAVSAPPGQAAQVRATASLDHLAGEYTDPEEPDTPLSVYVQGGKLTVESERQAPDELRQVSPTEFAIPNTRITLRFTLDDSGQGATVATSDAPDAVFRRTGEPVHHVFHDYRRSEAMIPMRDGVKLHAVILRPADIADAASLPDPAHAVWRGRHQSRNVFSRRPELARAGYIYVGEDIRGRFKSEGQFVMSRPLADHHDPKAIDESTDAYDTVAWLLKNVSGNNGRAGFVGTSYPGFLAMMAGIDPHPAVKAISPQAPMIDVWMGDDFFHNGAFRQTYGYDYVYGMESNKRTAKSATARTGMASRAMASSTS